MMTSKDVTCVGCPKGCLVRVELDEAGAVVAVSGNRCPRGDAYARKEVLHPERVVTGLVRVAGVQTPLSLKTTGPVPRERMADVIDAMRAACVRRPVAMGQVIIADVLGLGVDVVATREL